MVQIFSISVFWFPEITLPDFSTFLFVELERELLILRLNRHQPFILLVGWFYIFSIVWDFSKLVSTAVVAIGACSIQHLEGLKIAPIFGVVVSSKWDHLLLLFFSHWPTITYHWIYGFSC